MLSICCIVQCFSTAAGATSIACTRYKDNIGHFALFEK